MSNCRSSSFTHVFHSRFIKNKHQLNYVFLFFMIFELAFLWLWCRTKLFGMYDMFSCSDLLFLFAWQVFFCKALVGMISQTIFFSFEQTASLIGSPVLSQLHTRYFVCIEPSWVTKESFISNKLSSSSTLSKWMFIVKLTENMLKI